MGKKILIINTTFKKGGASSVARELFFDLNKNGFDAYFAYGRGEKTSEAKTFKFGFYFETLVHIFLVRFLGLEGFGSYFSTKRLINYIKKEKFDLIHFHNLHGYYLNFYQLIKFLNKSEIPVFWTLHDEWALNVLKAHDVESYPYPKTYNKLFLDFFFKHKQSVLKSIKNLKIISPAKWLAEKVRDSYLKDGNVNIISNGVDINLFKPADDKIFLRKKNGLPENKKIVLFPADKEIKYILQIQEILRDKNYFFLGLSGIKDYKKVAEIFALSDLFCMTSIAETQPLVVLEAFASGVPVVGFDVIGLRELINEKSGGLVPFGDTDKLSHAINTNLVEEILKEKSKNVRNIAVESFSKKSFLESYLLLYKEILK